MTTAQNTSPLRRGAWRAAIAAVALVGAAVGTAQAAPTPEQQMQVDRVFQRLDRDDDGYIEAREIQRRMTFTTAQLREADKNRDGRLDRAEFTEMLGLYFGNLDRNGDGMLDRREMRRANIMLSPEDMRRIDRDGDGTLDLSEYIWATTRNWAPRNGWGEDAPMAGRPMSPR